MEKRPDHDMEPRHGGHRRNGRDPDDFFGLDVDRMSPRSQVTTSLAVLIPLALVGVLVLTLASNLWWLIFVFGWVLFPAFALLVRGIAGISEGTGEPTVANAGERELLEALQRRGELTPAQAAIETSLTVDEADKMLEDLAAKGHLDVKVRGGGLFYRLWEGGSGAARGEIGGER
ncbi:MAG TPA: hypothetical protein VFY59_00610 [Rubrobacter sp.]|nr:hypothetical protein [Rubrobacter sp.]